MYTCQICYDYFIFPKLIRFQILTIFLHKNDDYFLSKISCFRIFSNFFFKSSDYDFFQFCMNSSFQVGLKDFYCLIRSPYSNRELCGFTFTFLLLLDHPGPVNKTAIVPVSSSSGSMSSGANHSNNTTIFAKIGRLNEALQAINPRYQPIGFSITSMDSCSPSVLQDAISAAETGVYTLLSVIGKIWLKYLSIQYIRLICKGEIFEQSLILN